MATNVVEVKFSDLDEFRQVLDAHTTFFDAARPLFSTDGPVTGSPAWQAAWRRANDALVTLTEAKARFPRPREVPPSGALLMCIICACDKPWGVFDARTGAAACIDCRDKARESTPTTPPPAAAAGECGYITQGHYTCNGSPRGCEGERFGGCVYCDSRKAAAGERIEVLGRVCRFLCDDDGCFIVASGGYYLNHAGTWDKWDELDEGNSWPDRQAAVESALAFARGVAQKTQGTSE